jgi:hypothetical protein
MRLSDRLRVAEIRYPASLTGGGKQDGAAGPRAVEPWRGGRRLRLRFLARAAVARFVLEQRALRFIAGALQSDEDGFIGTNLRGGGDAVLQLQARERIVKIVALHAGGHV